MSAITNQSVVSEFVLIGIPGLVEKYHSLVSTSMFIAYIISLIANSVVILLIILKRSLHQPMYIIIANLAFSDLLFDTITLPKSIAKYWLGADTISFYACIIQIFSVHYLGSLDALFLMLMAIDRYIAICKPLRYHSIITNKLVIWGCSMSWALDAFYVTVPSVLVSRLTYCGPNKVKNFFCSNQYVTPLSCDEFMSVLRLCIHFGLVVLLVPLAIIILSYILIIRVIHLSANGGNWQKAFYTCTTHLFAIGLYFVPRAIVYIIIQSSTIINSDLSVIILCFYTYIPHLASPIIYCLRTAEIRSHFEKTFKKIFYIGAAV
ncbi:hypothetical protein GDO86_019666 [Hymenochirus boettgeri]|uniref:Olfactory receptor n=1 Tax=Hymenochirus boettgeri TaxID=247094 RepID=A0A8T2ILC0_9PIPI|nr:hypothetical protein GDO86_019666 [Hymenochirus boettgeri]